MSPFQISHPDLIIESPGRINLIGEHIDYNGGQVLPAAINLKIRFFFERTDSDVAKIYSKDLDQSFEIALNNLENSKTEWHNFFLGVIHFILKIAPNSIKGFNCIVESNLPFGAGVSSSAALECGIAKGLDLLFDIGLKDSEIITLSRDAEHDFVGTKCGIMDQFAVVRGKKNFLIQLNCADLSYKYVPADFSPYTILLLNTNVAHNLASSEYNLRRQACEKGLRIINEKYPEYRFLAHVPLKVLEELKSQFPENLYKRLTYVVEENLRTIAAGEVLEKNDLNSFGKLLFESHKGLSTKYEVSCEELDFLVQYAASYEGIIGARMMG
ncbi:galactokinase, partial [Eudoraea sp.]|uniref:galactokinase n=1 Tax=Eudoraea sp. TaxID=1979955 RepID=UPI003C73E3B8